MHNFWAVDYILTYLWSGGKCQSKQAGEGIKKKKILSYLYCPDNWVWTTVYSKCTLFRAGYVITFSSQSRH